MNRPIHFEIHAPDPEAAIAFYQKTLGWTFQKWDGPMEYWLVRTGQGAGIDGGLMRSRDGQPRTVNTILVADVDRACATIREAGGQVVVDKFPVRGVGWVAYGTDPGGNIFGVMHEDASAP